MAFKSPFPSYVLTILKAFQYANNPARSLTRDELIGLCLDGRNGVDRISSERLVIRIEKILHELTELGLITPDVEYEQTSGLMRWRVADYWRPPPNDGGGGRGDNKSSETNESNDGGGGGLRETLGHPVLFALDHNDFDHLVSGLFEDQHS